MRFLQIIISFIFPACFTRENVTEHIRLLDLEEKILTMYRQPSGKDTFNVTNSLVQYLWELRSIQQLCKDGSKEGKRCMEALKTAGGPITYRTNEWAFLLKIYPFDKVEIKELQLCFDNINAIWDELKSLYNIT